MGCLFAMFAGLFPRLALFILWIARPARIDAAFDSFLWPLLGIIFLPFATLMYVLLYTPGRGLIGWDWFWVGIAALLDIGHWVAGASQRNQFPGRRTTGQPGWQACLGSQAHIWPRSRRDVPDGLPPPLCRGGTDS